MQKGMVGIQMVVASTAPEKAYVSRSLHLKASFGCNAISLHCRVSGVCYERVNTFPNSAKWLFAARQEGGAVPCRCPLAAPTGAALHSTKRGSRYWRLRSAVAAAVHHASSPSQEAVPISQSAESPVLPSKLEVRAHPHSVVVQLCNTTNKKLHSCGHCSRTGQPKSV